MSRLSTATALAVHLAAFALTLLGAALLLQLLLAMAPGDAADLVAGDPILRQALVERWGLDLPVWRRTLVQLAGMLRGDFGESLTVRPGTPVGELVWLGARSSAPLLAGALALSLCLATLSAARAPRLGRALSTLSVVPVFLLAASATSALNEQTFAGMEAGWWGRPEWFALPLVDHPLKTALAILCLAIGSGAMAELHQSSAEALSAISRSGYVQAARARGAPLWPLILRNYALPLSAMAARRTAFFVGGLVVIEKVLAVQGAGAMLWQAARMRDWPLVVGLSLLAAAVVAGARLLADLTRLAIDPRLRTGR